MNIIWIASYPRSGNTWMRMLTHDLLFGPAESSTAMQFRIPDIHRSPSLDVRREGTILAKTHFQLAPAHPYLKHTVGCIYLIRDPRDVAISAANYARMFDDNALDDKAQFIREYVARGGVDSWLRQGFGTWSQHADTWQSIGGLPLLLVRYEDLRRDTAGELSRVVEFMGLKKSRDEIEQVVARNALDELRRMEEKEKRADSCWFPGSAEQLDRGARFFNTGKIGQRLDDIEPGLDALFDEAFGEAMVRHGYEPVTRTDTRPKAALKET